MFKVLILMAMLLGLSACATASKTSKLEYLDEGTTTKAKSTTIQDNLKRQLLVKKKGKFLNDQEKSEAKTMGRPTEYKEISTDTQFIIYPYTKPFLKARITETVSETGFKDRWEESKIQAEIQNQFTKDSENLVSKKQCFSLEIAGSIPAALQLKYWYGKIHQNGKTQDLTFSDASSFTVKTTQAISNTYNYSKYYSTSYHTFHDTYRHHLNAIACGTGPIDLTSEFSIVIDVRYQKDLAPITVVWKDPKK